MMGWARAARGGTAVLILFVLGACAQTQLAVHAIKEVQKRSDAPETAGVEHLKALALVSRTLRDPMLRRKLRANPDGSTLFTILTEAQSVQAA